MKTGIEIKISFFPLAWFLYFVEPIIEINGVKHKKEWGAHWFDLDAGPQMVRVYFSYMGKAECGLNQIEFELTTNETKTISYYMSPFLFLKGKIKISKNK
jgi:hypothetical protein